MPQQVPRHSDELKSAIIEASKTGLSGTAITQQLAGGHLAGWDGPYAIAAETVRLYISTHRKEQRAKQDAVPLDHGLGTALYGTASKIYRELERRVDEALDAKDPVSIDHLDSLARTLKTLEGFVKLRPTGTASTPQTTDIDEDGRPVPNDPILAAAQRLDPVPSPSMRIQSANKGLKDERLPLADDDTTNPNDGREETGSVPRPR